MNDIIAIAASLLLVVGSLSLLVFSPRCQHTTLDLMSQTCAGCGMSQREILRKYRHGEDNRLPRFTSCGNSPFDRLWNYLEYHVEPAPPGSPYLWIEYTVLVKDAPPDIQRLYRGMLYRRYGFASLWRTRA